MRASAIAFMAILLSSPTVVQAADVWLNVVFQNAGININGFQKKYTRDEKWRAEAICRNHRNWWQDQGEEIMAECVDKCGINIEENAGCALGVTPL